MHFSERDPMDIPAPPTADEVAALFTVAVMSFVPQPSLSELGVGTIGSSLNDGPAVLDAVSLSYTMWRNPSDHDDPINLAEMTDAERQSLDSVPPRPLPNWLVERRRLARFPSLWEAVTTTRLDGEPWQRAEFTLVQHANHILQNTFQDQRILGEFPGELIAPLTERHIERVDVVVDGVEVPGMRIDTDPDVFAIGALLDDRILTSVVARDYLPNLTIAFATRDSAS